MISMERYCGNCGARLPEQGTFCPQCGVSRVSGEPDVRSIPLSQEPTGYTQGAAHYLPNSNSSAWVTPEPVKTEKKHKLKWWIVAIAAVLVVVLAVFLLWEPLYVRIAPQAALSKAAFNTMEDLASRYEGNPIAMMDKISSCEQIAGEGEFVITIPDEGDIRANISVVGDRNKRQVLLEMGMAVNVDYSASVSADLDFYMDPDFMALNLDQVTNGTFYGIAYDTFGKDIRSNQLILDAISESGVTSIEEWISYLQEAMNAEEAEYEPSEAYTELLTQFLTAQKPDVSNEKVKLGRKEYSCYAISYLIPISDLGDFADSYVDLIEDDEMLRNAVSAGSFASQVDDPEYFWDTIVDGLREMADSIQDIDGDVTICFHIYKNHVVNINMNFDGTRDSGDKLEIEASFLLGEDPTQGDIVLNMDISDDKKYNINIVLSTEKDDSTISQSLEFNRTGSDNDGTLTLAYEWDREAGDLELEYRLDTDNGSETDKFSQTLILKEEDDGFRITISDFDSIPSMQGMDCSLSLYFHEGKRISVPQYTNIKDLTSTDLYDMLINIQDNYG